MIIYMNRGLCDASLPYCARCSAAFFRKPMGTDRPCVSRIIDDGQDDILHFVVNTDDRTLEFDLTKDLQEGLSTEGWEFLIDFDPALFRHGAAERWRKLSQLPAQHAA
jgi:hypothetical protein